MSLTKIKITTGPVELEIVDKVAKLSMPQGITIEIEKEGEDLEGIEQVSGGPLKFNIEELLGAQGRV